jgi:AraC-like DNA-binding protein
MNNRDADIFAMQQWQSKMSSICGDLEVQLPKKDRCFVGDLNPLDETEIIEASEIRTNAGRIQWNDNNPDTRDVDQCFLVMHNSGFAYFKHQLGTLHLKPGDVFLLNSTDICEIIPQGIIEHTSLPIKRQRVQSTLGKNTPLFGKINQQKTSGLMLKTMLERLTMNDEGMVCTDEKEGVESALLALLKSSLLANDEPLKRNLTRDLWKSAQILITRKIQERELTPTTLAKQLNISVRQLHRVFEEHGNSVCRFIQRTRLDRCASDLTSKDKLHQSITNIAYTWGFNDSAHFSKAFKKEYGMSPKDYRNQQKIA